ncbi:BatD family protein [Lutimonas zeaxanthinifaciens]|uniref:BatD family protein n=1 Tax=Lutimonas zeaxanthinifaciens TaxID=3060215 RepID=UPI00265CBD0F|nr:BatD family protein [Lutimonas sp. YSD2104]WKK65835.1 BatD family protein [Lutimonas sp. YSD2104]
MKRKFLSTLIILLTVQGVMAQVTFKTAVSKTELGLNERLRIEFSIDRQGGDDFTPPDFKNFKVLAGPSQSSSFSSINGRTSYKLTYTYVIQPISKGTFIIPSATITYEGEEIKSNTVRVTVSDAIEIPEDPNDPRYVAQQNIHLVAEVSNLRPYVGESISVVYKLYVDTEKVNVQNTREASSPSFNGFWNQNIEVKKWVAKNGTYGGKPHRFVIVRKMVLIPHKSGELEIDPLEMEITAGVPIGRRDFFGNMLMNDVNFTLTSGKKTIRVKELPEEGKPFNFTGAVGDYKFSVTPNKTVLKANESALIKVELKGKGNLKLVKLPGIETSSGLEVYEPEYKENIKTTLSGLTGSVYDQYAIVPQSRGKFQIPSVGFSYFNPKEQKYYSIESEPILLNALQGAEPVDEAVVSNKKSVISNEGDIRYIALKSDFVSVMKEDDFFGSNLFYWLMILPLLSIPLGIFIGKKKQERDSDIIGNKRRKADRLARRYLSQAKKELGRKEAFYIALEKALHNYLKAKLHVETSEISREKIAEILKKKEVDQDTISEFSKVLENCDYARYTPSTDVMMKKEYENAKTVISKIDKQL